jgi:uncharacterized SAM-binding protein YcdF (DUF218 family)
MGRGKERNLMFILKKWISQLFFPLPLAIELLLIAFLWPRRGRKFLFAGLVLLYFFSFQPFSSLLLWPLERTYPPVQETSINREVKWIVVLGGASKEGKNLTPEDRLSEPSLKRLLEGIRLSRHLPEARLILSGGDFSGATPVAKVMHVAALKYGLTPSRLVLEENSWDTYDEARLLNKTLSKDFFYLVTSASHMPRSMAMFKKMGSRPIAAPADFQVVWGPLKGIDFFPKAAALSDSERAFHEYLGLLWGWWKGLL